MAEVGILLSIEPSERRRGLRQRIEICFSSLKRVFQRLLRAIDGEPPEGCRWIVEENRIRIR